ncbi:MAG: NADP-dependent oxidoreductase [Polyangiales bacterium]
MNGRSRALRLHVYGERDGLRVDDVAPPAPQGGEVLVAVKAAGVNPLDHKLASGWLRQGFALTLPATLGLELAGEVVALGPSAGGRFAVGDRVMGLARMNAYADVASVPEDSLVATPAGLSDVQAASIPVAALTAWQILRAAGEPRPGRTVLVHGASGGVGGFAVQLAKASGARVLATTTTESVAYVRALGADVVFDRRVERFEDRARDVDLVLDLAGGDTVARSWAVLAPEGAVVTIATMDIAAQTPAGKRGLWMRMKGDPGAPRVARRGGRRRRAAHVHRRGRLARRRRRGDLRGRRPARAGQGRRRPDALTAAQRSSTSAAWSAAVTRASSESWPENVTWTQRPAAPVRAARGGSPSGRPGPAGGTTGSAGPSGALSSGGWRAGA